MAIAPFSFREFGQTDSDIIAAAAPKSFLPQSRKKEAAPPPPPPPPVFSESDLKSAERDGYQRGFLDGVTEGKTIAHNAQAEVDAALSKSVELFSQQLVPLFESYRDMMKHIARQTPELAQAIARKIAGCALEEKAYQVIETMAVRCLETMYHEPKLVIIVHDSLRATLEEKINQVNAALRSPVGVTVVGDANIALANCRIEWNNGAMVRDTEQLWQHVEQVIASMVASGERDAEAACDALEPTVIQPKQPPEGE